MTCEHGVPEYGFCEECCREINKKEHAYFIVYSFEDYDEKAGVANGAVDMTHPIRGPEDVMEIQEIFRRKTGHRLCVLINWKKFEEDI